MTEPLNPEVVDTENPENESPLDEQVTRPAKLIRIASMVRSMLEEVRRSPLDEAGRKHLAEIHERSIGELNEILSPELQEELRTVVLPFSREETPSDSELRIAQAQLVGWLEGLFHGIQATLFTQQMAAQSQMEEIKRKMLSPGQPGADINTDPGSGAYL